MTVAELIASLSMLAPSRTNAAELRLSTKRVFIETADHQRVEIISAGLAGHDRAVTLVPHQALTTVLASSCGGDSPGLPAAREVDQHVVRSTGIPAQLRALHVGYSLRINYPRSTVSAYASYIKKQTKGAKTFKTKQVDQHTTEVWRVT